MPRDIRKEFYRYAQLLTKYTTSEEANERYGDVLVSIWELCTLFDKYYATDEMGKNPVLTSADTAALRDAYQKVFNASSEFRRSVDGAAQNMNTKARGMLLDSMEGLLTKDMIAMSGMLDGDRRTLPQLLNGARSYRVNVAGQELSQIGEVQSKRIPVSFTDGSGRQFKGFFTENTTADKQRELQELYNKAIADHPEFGRAFESVISDKYFQSLYADTIVAAEYLTEKLQSDDLAHTFDDYLLTSLPKYRFKGKTPTQQEVQEYINSITCDETFAVRMAEFCRGYAVISQKYDAVLKTAGIKTGSIMEERSAAMSAVADLLGVPQLIARSVNMQLVTDDGDKNGVFIEAAEGSDIAHLREDDPVLAVTREGLDNPEVFRSIADLQTLDYICGNVDRHVANIFYRFENTLNGPKLVGIKGIDNDCSFGDISGLQDINVSNMVAAENMLVISESMANRIASLTPDMLKAILRNYSLSDQELNAAWGRVEHLQQVINDGVTYFDEHQDERLTPGHLRVIKDDEWRNYTLTDLAHRNGMLDTQRFGGTRSNYFESLYFIAGDVQADRQRADEKKRQEQEIVAKHPALAKENGPLVFAAGETIKGISEVGITDMRRRMERFGMEMEAVNKGAFISSDAFNNVMRAFKAVQKTSSDAAVEENIRKAEQLQRELKHLQECLAIYLAKKAKEKNEKLAKHKQPSAVAERRTNFAKRLMDFVDERVEAVEKDISDILDKKWLESIKTKACNFMMSVYMPQPEFYPDQAGTVNANGEVSVGAYTREGFDSIRRVDVNGLNFAGRQITDEEFASLAIAAVLQPGFAERARAEVGGDNGIEPEVRAENAATMFTADAAGAGEEKLSPRARVFAAENIEKGINPAKESVEQALRRYQNGDRTQMAKIIAHGLLFFYRWATDVRVCTSKQYAMTHVHQKLVDMLEADPELRQATEIESANLLNKYSADLTEVGGRVQQVVKDFEDCAPDSPDFDEKGAAYVRTVTKFDFLRKAVTGTMSESIRVIRGYSVAEKIGRRCDEAIGKLKDAAESGQKLSVREKADCLRDILADGSLNASIAIQSDASDAKLAAELGPTFMKLGASKMLSQYMYAVQAPISAALRRPPVLIAQLGDKNGMKALKAFMEKSVSEDTLRQLMQSDEDALCKKFKDVLSREEFVKKSIKAIEKQRAEAEAKKKAAQPQAPEDQLNPPVNG